MTYTDQNMTVAQAKAMLNTKYSPTQTVTLVSGKDHIDTKMFVFLHLRAKGLSTEDIIQSIVHTVDASNFEASHFSIKKGAFKSALHNIAGAVKKVGKLVSSAVKAFIQSAEFIPLIPFKGAMKHFLDTNKIKYDNGDLENAHKFLLHIKDKPEWQHLPPGIHDDPLFKPGGNKKM